MHTAKHIGRVGALAVALGIGTFRRNATRATVSIGVAALAMAAAAGPVSTESPAVMLSADSTALLLCGTACPTWNDAHVEDIKNQFIAPTHPLQTIDYVPVTAPMELWPITGLFRVLGLLGFGEPGCARPGGDCWPDYPLWKLSGLFDLTVDQSIGAGVVELEEAMTEAGNGPLVIYGDNQGSIVANVVKRKLAEQYPDKAGAPDIDFVLTSDFNVPNGGVHARFPGLYIPVLDWTFDGAEPTDTPFDTDVIIRQYDGFADFPLYPLNVVASLNALLGVIYVSPFLFDVSLQPDPTASPPTVTQQDNTTYYFFKTDDLPLFGPLRTLGVPEPLIDVVEPFFRELVELGYDRTIPPGEPTPARLIPPLDTFFDSIPLLNKSVAAAEQTASMAIEAGKAAGFQPITSTDTEQAMSTENITETLRIPAHTAMQTNDAAVNAKANDATADQELVNVSVATGGDATIEPEPTARTAMSRPVARPFQKVGDRIRDLLTGANRSHSTIRTAITGGDHLAKGGSISAAPSSPGSPTTGSDSSAKESSDSGGDPE